MCNAQPMIPMQRQVYVKIQEGIRGLGRFIHQGVTRLSGHRSEISEFSPKFRLFEK